MLGEPISMARLYQNHFKTFAARCCLDYISRVNAKAYSLLVSLVAVIGLLFSVVPCVRGALEYRAPWVAVAEPEDLASLDAFILKHGGERHIDYYREQLQPAYTAARAQYAANVSRQIEYNRQRAARQMAAYGALFALCLVLLLTHLLWFRRVKDRN
jgi:hypothetical protein